MDTSADPSVAANSGNTADLYQLICRQLQQDGYQDLAIQLASRSQIQLDDKIPADLLATIVNSKNLPISTVTKTKTGSVVNALQTESQAGQSKETHISRNLV